MVDALALFFAGAIFGYLITEAIRMAYTEWKRNRRM